MYGPAGFQGQITQNFKIILFEKLSTYDILVMWEFLAYEPKIISEIIGLRGFIHMIKKKKPSSVGQAKQS